MSYSKTTWQNLPNTTTPVNATRMNNIENGIADANGAIGVNNYSNSATYAVGAYCMYNNILYRCKTAIMTGESFNSSKWQQIKIMNEIRDTGNVVSSTEPIGINKNIAWFKKGKNLAWKGWAEDFVARINNTARAKLVYVDNRNCLQFWANAGYKEYDTKYMFKTDFKPNTQYTFQFTIYSTQNKGNIAIEHTDGSTVSISSMTTSTWNNITLTSSANKTVKYLRVSYLNDTSYIDLSTFMVEQGATASTYEEPIECQKYLKNNNDYEKFVDEEIKVNSAGSYGNNTKVWFRETKNLLKPNFSAYDVSGTYGYLKLTDNQESMIISVKDNDTSVDMSGIYFGFSLSGSVATGRTIWICSNGTLTGSSKNNINITTGEKLQYFSFYPKTLETFNKIFSRFYVQVEKRNSSYTV